MSDLKGEILARLRDEIGTIDKEAPESVALLYPSPYRVGMSSLGYQTIYRSINLTEGRAAHRAFLPDDLDAWRQSRAPLVTHEKLRPVSDYPIIAVSVAYETELAGLIQCLQLAGIPPLAEERNEQHPFILAGGPLTFSNPLPLAPFVDAVVMGEADQSVHEVLSVIFGSDSKDSAMRSLSRHPHVFVPSAHGDLLPPIDKTESATLPAYSQIITPHTELRNMFLIEPERGCHRGCTYCVMRRSTNDGMRIVKMDRVLSLIPDEAKRVGLVGAATTDHPQITEIVHALADSGREVGLSSLRADRLNDELVAALRRGGHRVLTTASDGASQRMRDIIQRKTSEEQLRRAAELARRHAMKRLKLYVMVGVPDETDEDIDELIELGGELSSLIPLSLGVAPFVAKRNTPLDGSPFAGIPLVEARLRRLRRGVRGRVELRATSARWAWVEYVLAQGGRAEGRAVLDAVHAGGRFADWKRAFNALPEQRPRRLLVRPGDRLGRARAG
ncbi:MAG: radical SAM protein [Myxococcales bacterium]|nr:B12-binding domain-containing radical SAM protein [Deltaproteobacteria bacterium]NNK07090.1 radical SAM protein [Myxococcales bacterium]MBT8480648.1 B12-binding domain-containing radical SAM protein [Deltaproteobacteria bacterium]NNK41090.1 radical SAM protein [Myxococcales bacterium]NNL23514.1 radical SAM protein [Myxococcales bacterium]